MSELTIKGKIKLFLPIESGVAKSSGKEWQKQNFIVSNNDGYEGKEQIFCFEVFGQEKIDNLSKFNKEGDEVVVSFNVSTNEWNGKYYTSLSAWLVKKSETGESSIPKSVVEPFNAGTIEPENLPF